MKKIGIVLIVDRKIMLPGKFLNTIQMNQRLKLSVDLDASVARRQSQQT
jgi:hypothetical protein